MRLGKHLGLYLPSFLALALAGCSGGSSSSTNSIETALQDLTLDADGLVTVLTFDTASGLGGATTANFSASGGQTATDVSVAGDTVTITWDALVSPAHTVATVGLGGVDDSAHAVATSDDSAPTYTITSAEMNAGLGTDVITVTFDGPHVDAATAENLAHWVLSADGNDMDLAGSSFDFDAGTQVLTMSLGPTANVWADLTLSASGVKSVADTLVDDGDVAGAGSGDSTAPTLVSANQNLTEDEFGRVIDFTFLEAISPLCAEQLARYGGTSPDVAVSAEQLSATIVRVTFNNPIVPGVDTVLLNGLFDAHGNAFPDTVQAISQPSPVANAVDGAAGAVTVADTGGDYMTLVTTQAFDPDSAEDYANWTLHVAGNPIDLSTQTFAYDLDTKTTTITLDFDLENGDTFTLVASTVVDVDGQQSGLGDFETVAGDSTAPGVTAVVQNRTIDPTGSTVDVAFDEDMDETAAETAGNWSSSGTQNVVSATLLPNGSSVRLVFDAPMIPTVDGVSASAQEDLAGNVAAYSGNVGSSTDSTAPTVTVVDANAVEGPSNDTLVVTFDDDIWETSVTDPANWTLESPVGNAVSLAGCSVDYDATAKRATLTLDTGVNLQTGDDFSIAFGSVYDIAHNAVGSGASSGDVDAETTLPEVISAYLESSVADEVVLSFSEPCTQLTDLYDSGTNPTGTRFVLRDNLGTSRGTATAASVIDGGLGVRLSFGVVVAGTDTLDVLGVTDLAGNPLFPVLAQALLAEDTTAPTILSATGTTVPGESNDVLVVVFDRPMSPWGLLDKANWTLTMSGAGNVELNRAAWSFDGTATVTITLSGTGNQNLATSDNFSVDATNLYSVQGVVISGTSSIGPLGMAGDLTAPGVGISDVRLDPATADSLLIEFDEAVDPAAAETLANYDLNSGNLATAASLVGPRVVRATFGITPLAGDTLDVIGEDMALNVSGLLTRTVQSADATGPLVSSVSGVATPGYGGDTVTVVFSEPVQTSTAFSPANYVITSNGNPISLAGATAEYVSSSHTVVFHLASGQELDSSVVVAVSISSVQDVAGNAMPSTVATSGAVTGDIIAPDIASSFVNWLVDASGATIDVQFDEDVTSFGAGNILHWGTSGAASVSSVTRLDDDHYRVTFSAALAAVDLVTIGVLDDPAGNLAAGTPSTDPVE